MKRSVNLGMVRVRAFCLRAVDAVLRNRGTNVSLVGVDLDGLVASMAINGVDTTVFLRLCQSDLSS